jgi:hypothetical protein
MPLCFEIHEYKDDGVNSWKPGDLFWTDDGWKPKDVSCTLLGFHGGPGSYLQAHLENFDTPAFPYKGNFCYVTISKYEKGIVLESDAHLINSWLFTKAEGALYPESVYYFSKSVVKPVDIEKYVETMLERLDTLKLKVPDLTSLSWWLRKREPEKLGPLCKQILEGTKNK